MIRVLSVFGTRPEAIKMAPVIRELGRHPEAVESVVCVTAQHREMLDQVLRLFGITPDIDLDLMEADQSPAVFAARALPASREALDKVRPDLVLVQGDTATAFAASLAAFYDRVPVGHVEAGLRTHMRYSPFPEEMHRRLVGALATYHFAPTSRAAAALREEGVPAESVFITGNPVIDALQWINSRTVGPDALELLRRLGLEGPLGGHDGGWRTLLVTAHRRESFGERLVGICHGLKNLVRRNPDVQIVFPVHPNPSVRSTVFEILSGDDRIHLLDPLPYETLIQLMSRACLVVTDSGGLQEEGPAIGKPVLVLRDDTERPEAVEAGVAKVVGTDPKAIVEEAERLLHDAEAYRRMACRVSPFGDGRAAERIVRIILGRVTPASAA